MAMRNSGPKLQTFLDPAGIFEGDRAYEAPTELSQSAERQAAYGQYQNTFQDQQGALHRLNQRAMGMGGPSVAEQQMQSGLANINSQVMGTAAGARGVNRTDAQMNAQRDMARLGSQVNRDAATMRAQEQMQAEQGYMQGLAGLQAQNMGQQQLGQLDQQMMLKAMMDTRQTNEGMRAGRRGAISNTLGTIGGAVFSDIRAKEAIQPAPRAEIGLAQLEPRANIGEAQIESVGETTALSPEEERQFQQWAAANNVQDVNDPRAYYDYRGFWRETRGVPIRWGEDHFPDTYKQHGHPTFSVESQYSKGPNDGGSWQGETFVPAPKGPRATIGQAQIEAVGPEALSQPAVARDALAPVEPYSFRYKPEAAQTMGTDTDPRLGVMAQDLERGQLGSLVEDTPQGKAIDGPKAVSALLALVAAQDKRLKALEGGGG